MTGSQITYLLGELDTQFSTGGTLYGEDLWIEMDEISEIILSSDENIYPDERLQVYFDSTTEILYTREGYYQDNTFNVVRVASATPYSQIIGFITTKPNSTKSPYKKSSSI